VLSGWSRPLGMNGAVSYLPVGLELAMVDCAAEHQPLASVLARRRSESEESSSERQAKKETGSTKLLRLKNGGANMGLDRSVCRCRCQ
jgi:hypothetical protein